MKDKIKGFTADTAIIDDAETEDELIYKTKPVVEEEPTIKFQNMQYEPKWIVTIPKKGSFNIYFPDDINWWQRMWIKFIGWGIKKA